MAAEQNERLICQNTEIRELEHRYSRERDRDKLIQLELKMEQQEIRHAIEIRHLTQRNEMLEKRLLQLERLPLSGNPFIWRIENASSCFQQLSKGKKPFIKSDDFLMCHRLMFLRLYVVHDKLAFSVHLKKKKDDHLREWPFVAKFALSLLDQSGRPLHSRQDMAVECEFTENDPASQQPREETNPQGIVKGDIISIGELIQAPYCTGDDVVVIKVEVL